MNFAISALATSLLSLLKELESTSRPSASKAASSSEVLESETSALLHFCASALSSGTITSLIGKSYFFANSKSLWSWAGTDIIAPVPYSISTKFAIYIGIFSSFAGFIA